MPLQVSILPLLQDWNCEDCEDQLNGTYPTIIVNTQIWYKYNVDTNTESLSTFCAAKINKCVLETNTKLLLMKIQKTYWHKYKIILGENAKIILRQIQTNHNCLKPSVLSALLLLCLLFNFPLTPEKKVLLITNHLTLDADLKEQLDMLVDTSTKLLLVLYTHLCNMHIITNIHTPALHWYLYLYLYL